MVGHDAFLLISDLCDYLAKRGNEVAGYDLSFRKLPVTISASERIN
jgi:hypothetical protein